MLKITLINPPQFSGYPQPPVGLALIAAVLEREGYQVKLLDANVLNIKPEDIIPLITDADVVGLTAMTPTISTAIGIARLLKKANPALTIILGGAHATLLPEETLATSPAIDVIVRGEGEETIIELLRAFEENQPLGSIPGICFRDDGQIVSSASRSPITDIDSLLFPAYQLLPLHSYK
ncbi:B12-binding domain-containing radical SAM protein, partial [Chloroflexota bacterium]